MRIRVVGQESLDAVVHNIGPLPYCLLSGTIAFKATATTHATEPTRTEGLSLLIHVAFIFFVLGLIKIWTPAAAAQRSQSIN